MNIVNTVEDFKKWAKENGLDDKSSPLYSVACNVMDRLENQHINSLVLTNELYFALKGISNPNNLLDPIANAEHTIELFEGHVENANKEIKVRNAV